MSTDAQMAALPETVWYPGSIFLEHTETTDDTPPAKKMKDFALLVLNQPLDLPMFVYRRLWFNAVFRVAADGGANRLFEKSRQECTGEANLEEDLQLETIIGDLDSLRQDVRAYFQSLKTEIIQDLDQESTDFGKAVNYIQSFSFGPEAEHTESHCESARWYVKYVKDIAVARPLDIVVLGGLGGRVDQGLSQLHQLYSFQQDAKYPSGRMFLLSSEAITFVLKPGKHRIKVRDNIFEHEGRQVGLGRYVGIIPMKEPSIITTKGLTWDVQDWRTEFGGQMSTSNLIKDEWAVIETTKDVLFTINVTLSIPEESTTTAENRWMGKSFYSSAS